MSSISRADIEAVYTLTPLQEGLLFHHLHAPESEAYFGQETYRFTGALDPVLLRQAWQLAVHRHAVLRTAFVWGGVDRMTQVVFHHATPPWTELDWRQTPPAEHRDRLAAFLELDRQRGMDVAKAPLLRLTLIRTADDEHHFVVSQHHLVIDGWSYGLLLKEVMAQYQSLRAGTPLTLPAPPQFREFVEWLGTREQWRAEEFWREQLHGVSAAPPLPFMRQTAASGGFGQVRWELPEEQHERFQSFVRANRLTPAAVLQGAWALLLARGGGDVVFGAATSLRPPSLPDSQAMVGPLMNTLPIRVRAGRDDRVCDVLARLRDDQAGIQEHGFASLVQIQGWTDVDRRDPLFHSILVVENYPTTVFEETYGADWAGDGRLRITPIEGFARTHYPLTLHVFVRPRVVVEFVYDLGAFTPDAMRLLTRQFETLLVELMSDPQRRVADLPLMPETDRAEMLARSRGERKTWTDEFAPVHALISAQAARRPEAIAVLDGAREITYRELERHTNRLAQHLVGAGVGSDVRVAIYLERGWDAIAAILAVLKAGGAFVPADAGSPSERLESMWADAGAAILITHTALQHRVRPGAMLAICVDEIGDELAAAPETPPAVTVDGDNLAYVLFTSGSTGRPKGVAVTHRGLSNYLCWAVAFYGVAAGSGAPVHSSLAFDLTITSIFAPLLTGGRLTLLRDPRDLAALTATVFSGQPHSFVKVTPSHLRALNELRAMAREPARARVLILGGEQLFHDDVQPWTAGDEAPRVINEYGPTETVVGCVVFEAGAGLAPGPVPIGRPIANTEAFVLTAAGELAPAGVPGELFIGGAGVARGYIGDPALTAWKFVPHPFAADGGARLYRTGDRARWLPGGELEYLGRFDGQVKIRGHRIEIGEIEDALSRHAGVQAAAVLAPERGARGERVLVAFVVARSVHTTVAQLGDWLRRELPDYMVPERVVLLDAMPLNENGKIDRRSLLALNWNEPSADAEEPPRTETEQTLAAIWRELLGLDSVGREANFFRLGGHSLIATQLISRIHADLQAVLPIRAVFEAPTLAEMAALIEQAKRGELIDAPGLNDAVESSPLFARQTTAPVNLDELSEDEIDAYLASLPSLEAE